MLQSLRDSGSVATRWPVPVSKQPAIPTYAALRMRLPKVKRLTGPQGSLQMRALNQT